MYTEGASLPPQSPPCFYSRSEWTKQTLMLDSAFHQTCSLSSRCEEPPLLHPLPVLPHADGSLDVLRLSCVWVACHQIQEQNLKQFYVDTGFTCLCCVCSQTGPLAGCCIMRSRACGAWSPPWSAALPGCSASSWWPSITPPGPAWPWWCSSTRWPAARSLWTTFQSSHYGSFEEIMQNSRCLKRLSLYFCYIKHKKLF